MADPAIRRGLALSVILANPPNFGRSVILDQIQLRQNRLAQLSDAAVIVQIQSEIDQLNDALPAA
jgi:hypothetical protein